MNKFDLIDRESGLEYNMSAIEAFCGKLLEELSIDDWEFTLMFSDDEYIKELNNNYRGKNEPTDVLTFCEGDFDDSWETAGDIEEYNYVGDIVISAETLLQNSEYFKVDIQEELKRLIIHGILHLKGYDHETNDEEEEMLKLQEKILEKFGEYKF